MKNAKKFLSIFCSVAFILSLFFVHAKESSASEYNELDVDVNSGLAEGEVVVDTFTDLILDDEVVGAEVFFKQKDDLISPFERRLNWYGVSSTYVGLSYSPSWYYAGASTVSGGRLTASHSSSVAHKYSGTLKIPSKSLETVVGFDVTNSWSETVGYMSQEYPNGNYRLEYRHVYKKYKVKQEQKYDPRGKVYDTQYVYPEQWIERQYRVVKF
ncbi:hypothetical protein [Sporosarcina sp. FSL K6-1508]|uniref:hypothetical protein n=1 Tax=Sporosarcina sp. FSL K6-1508 TaxID=2921553 RepID=UPI0030F7C7CC